TTRTPTASGRTAARPSSRTSPGSRPRRRKRSSTTTSCGSTGSTELQDYRPPAAGLVPAAAVLRGYALGSGKRNSGPFSELVNIAHKGNVARGIPCGYDTKGAARYAISEENVSLLGIALIGGPHQPVNICSGPMKCDSPRSRSCIMRWQCFGDLLSRHPEGFQIRGKQLCKEQRAGDFYDRVGPAQNLRERNRLQCGVCRNILKNRFKDRSFRRFRCVNRRNAGPRRVVYRGKSRRTALARVELVAAVGRCMDTVKRRPGWKIKRVDGLKW